MFILYNIDDLQTLPTAICGSANRKIVLCETIIKEKVEGLLGRENPQDNAGNAPAFETK